MHTGIYIIVLKTYFFQHHDLRKIIFLHLFSKFSSAQVKGSYFQRLRGGIFQYKDPCMYFIFFCCNLLFKKNDFITQAQNYFLDLCLFLFLEFCSFEPLSSAELPCAEVSVFLFLRPKKHIFLDFFLLTTYFINKGENIYNLKLK